MTVVLLQLQALRKLSMIVLNQDAANVDVKNIKNVEVLQNYDVIFIGSAIQYNRWMPDAR